MCLKKKLDIPTLLKNPVTSGCHVNKLWLYYITYHAYINTICNLYFNRIERTKKFLFRNMIIMDTIIN